MAQKLRLGLQILPELGQIRFHGGKHCLQRLSGHSGLFQCKIQRRCIAAKLALTDSLQLNGVQRMSHRIPNSLTCCQLRFQRILTHLRIRISGQITDGGQIGLLTPIVYLGSAGDHATHGVPCGSAGHGHTGHNFFSVTLQQILAGSGQLLKIEGIVLKECVTPHQFHQLRQSAGPGLERGLRTGRAAEQNAQPALLGRSRIIPGIGSLPQAGIGSQLIRQADHPFQNSNALAQPLQRLHAVQTGRKGGQLSADGFQLLHIRHEGRIVKATV